MKHQYETGALRREPWPRKLVATVCAVALALLSVPLGVFHAPEIARAESYTVPADAQASGTSSSCSWYITSASDATNPGQLFIYPTDGISGTLGSFYSGSAVPWYSNAANIQSVFVTPGVKTSYALSFAFMDCSNATTIDLTNLDTGKATDLEALFKNCSSLTSIPGLESLDVADVTDFNSLFLNCKSLPSADLSGWDLSSATDIDYLFDTCSAIQSIKLPSTVAPNITSASQAFNNCKQITSLDVSCLENGNLQFISALFQGCQKLVNLTGYESLVTSSTTRMMGVFSGCNSLTSLDLTNWDTKNATNFYGLFSNCKSLTSLIGLDQWNTSKVTSLMATFQDVSKMTTIPGITNWDVSNVSSFYQTFTDCTALTSLDLSGWNTASGTTFDYMFGECENLQVLDISGFDTSAATNLSGMFTLNNHLQQVTLGSNFTFNGSGSTRLVNLPTPDPAYITGATGKWQAVGSGTVSDPAGSVYLPAEVPNNVAETYVMEKADAPVIPTLAANSTWFTQGGTSVIKGSITTINIVDSYSATGSEIASWDASAALDGSVMAYVSADGSTLTIAGNGYGCIYTNTDSTSAFADFTNLITISGLELIDTRNTTDMTNFFEENNALTSVSGIEDWDVSQVVSFNSTFHGCSELTSVDISKWDVSSATDMSTFFAGCEKLVDLKEPATKAVNLTLAPKVFNYCYALPSVDVGFLDSGKLENAGGMFQFCYELVTLTNYEKLVTSTTENISYMFNCCYKLPYLDVSQWDTSSADDFQYLFYNTLQITAIDGLENWTTKQVKDMTGTFCACKAPSLDNVSGWDVTGVRSFVTTFASIADKDLDLSAWTTTSIKDMTGMFRRAYDLESVIFGPGFTTPNVTKFSEMFSGCKHLKVLDISMFDTGAATNMTEMFKDMYVLQQVTLGSNFTFNGSGSTRLTNLPTPDPAYITGATGKWQAVNASAGGTVSDPVGTVYLPEEVPNNVAETYVMEKPAAPVIPTLAANSTWYTRGGTAIEKSSFATINIVDSYSTSGSETASWDASAEQNGSVMAYVSADGKTLTIAGNGYGCIYANSDSSFAFEDFTAATAINGTEILNTSNAKRMDSMFSECNALQSLNLDSWDVSKVYMFNLFAEHCYALTSLGPNNLRNWNTGAVEHFANAFDECRSLAAIDVSKWDMSSCQVTNYMFNGCSSLTNLDVSQWDLTSINKMAYTFAGCSNLQAPDVSNWNTATATDFSGLFSECGFASIDVSGLDLDSCTDIDYMFYKCTNLQTVDGINTFDTSKVKLMLYTFGVCTSLTELDLSNWSTPALTSAADIFYRCESLKQLDISGFDTSNAEVDSMFKNCYRLQQVTLGVDFTFNGKYSARKTNLPTPDPAYIPGAIGKWQAVGTGTVTAPAGTIYDPVDVPSNVAETYVMPLLVTDIDVPIKVILAVDAEGNFCTPTATGNKIINHSLLEAEVVSAETTAMGSFQLKQESALNGTATANAFGGTITAGSGEANDLSNISTTGSNWIMAAGNATDDSNEILLQLSGAIKNVKDHFFTVPTHVFGITYTFALDI